MLVFPCQVCHTQLSAEDAQAGQLVRCPTCLTTLRVPPRAAAAATAPVSAPAMAGAGVGGGLGDGPGRAGPGVSGTSIGTGGIGGGVGVGQFNPHRQGFGTVTSRGGKRYGFNCGYCSSRLEATESMAGQHGQCPTCGNDIIIPILDRYGRLIDPMTGKIIKQDPHPVHAYAAAGERAPRILRQPSGQQAIQCPRCGSISPITSNNCKSCGMPFTMEGTTLEATGASNGWCVASLVLGIIGIPAGCTVITPLLAIIFGIIGYNQVTKTGAEGGGKGMAIAGIICGLIGCIIAAATILS